MRIHTKQLLLILATATLLTACAGSGGRYSLKNDAAPSNAPDVSKVEDAHAKYEAYSRQGNKPYTVLGKSYQVLATGKDFSQTGYASWYGNKFHGHLTSNGETYDMYSMSGAHKTLPLPSYVRVTNLENDRQVIVRVNDRGPFHEGRIIDLSYSAAYKLDMLRTGTAKVKIETLYMEDPQSSSLAALQDTGMNYIQLTASKDKLKLQALANQLETKYQVKSRLQPVTPEMYRLQLGPVGQAELANKLLDTIKQDGYPQSYIIHE
ncbi:septal ring lytic transglycosylase RlpA family protein [Shewanella salipaludis]|uniref:Endolytic peptidoglycan transglycosylase RlpA n=1 Tax=Shewanella salipaludis TaxID=2723052 RepID=A0A972G4N1_9GAMM|nr:septal ring lytic transglycosylase RlpA family protein [Shewanella salipaludis]NMH67154.1 septal ring lytic transglycosylase RlpA family protein [Shewanella salipaludis]